MNQSDSTAWNLASGSPEYKAKVREFIAAHGLPVQFQKRWDWQDDDEVSVYGWTDYDAVRHCWADGSHPRAEEGCHWVVPEGARLYERAYSQFEGTFTDNKDEHGVNVTGCRCACGKYPDITLRWVGSVAEMLNAILGEPSGGIGRIEVEL